MNERLTEKGKTLSQLLKNRTVETKLIFSTKKQKNEKLNGGGVEKLENKTKNFLKVKNNKKKDMLKKRYDTK